MTGGTVPFALAGGSLIFVVFLVIFFFVLVFGYYTVKGSGISKTPYGDVDGASGPEKPDEIHSDFTEAVSDWERGTAGHHRHQHAAPVAPIDEEVAAALGELRATAGTGKLVTRDPRIGSARGPVGGADVVVFWDYTRSDRAMAASLAALHTIRPVRETALHLPLADERPLAWLAACAVEAAGTQHQFWAAHDELLERANPDAQAIYGLAHLVSDSAQFRIDVDSPAVRERVLEHIRLAGANGVHRAATVFIAGVAYDGGPDADELAAKIDLLASGSPRLPSAD